MKNNQQNQVIVQLRTAAICDIIMLGRLARGVRAGLLLRLHDATRLRLAPGIGSAD